MNLRAFDRVAYQLVYFELMILGCTVHCRFRFSDCTVIHCDSDCIRMYEYIITKTCLFNYIENFTTKKWKISEKKNLIFFHISAQNMDCWYSLEPPRRGGSNEYPQSMFWAEIRKIMYTPVNPSFTM